MSETGLSLRFYITGAAITFALAAGIFTSLASQPNSEPAKIPASVRMSTSTAQALSQQVFDQGQVNVLEKANAALAVAKGLLTEPVAAISTAEPVATAVHTWEISSESEALPKPSLSLSDQIKTYTLVKINQHPEKMPSVGERLSLPMVNGRTLAANVDSVTTLTNGDGVWTGHLDGYGEDFPVVMTYGDVLTFATIHTPEGSYSLEAKDGVGWLYKNPSIVELACPNYVDALVPTE